MADFIPCQGVIYQPVRIHHSPTSYAWSHLCKCMSIPMRIVWINYCVRWLSLCSIHYQTIKIVQCACSILYIRIGTNFCGVYISWMEELGCMHFVILVLYSCQHWKIIFRDILRNVHRCMVPYMISLVHLTYEVLLYSITIIGVAKIHTQVHCRKRRVFQFNTNTAM